MDFHPYLHLLGRGRGGWLGQVALLCSFIPWGGGGQHPWTFRFVAVMGWSEPFGDLVGAGKLLPVSVAKLHTTNVSVSPEK